MFFDWKSVQLKATGSFRAFGGGKEKGIGKISSKAFENSNSSIYLKLKYVNIDRMLKKF